MRKKATAKKASPRGTQGNANGNVKAKENIHLRMVKIVRPTKTPTGKGLGKAGAKRLGRLLKRAIQVQIESTGKGRASLPKTPVRLFKHQMQTEAEKAPKTNSAKPASPHVSHLILSVVSQCKNRGGLSMAELKQTLTAAGYNVTKNSRQVNLVTKRPVNNETHRITRSAYLRLTKKDTKQVKIIDTKPPKPKADLKQSNTARKSPRGAEKSHRPTRKTPKPRGKSRQPKGKTRKAAAKSHKPAGKTRKAATRTQKPKKTSPKARRKLTKPAGKKRRPATNRAARVRKAPGKAQQAQRYRLTQSRHPYKSTQTRQPPRRRLHNTRSRVNTQQRRVVRRRHYYD